jgi:hypothetical protein
MEIEIKIYYTLEDGNLGRNMYCRTVTTNTIKLNADGNMTCNNPLEGLLVGAQPCEAVKVGRVGRSSGHLSCCRQTRRKRGEDAPTGRERERGRESPPNSIQALSGRQVL